MSEQVIKNGKIKIYKYAAKNIHGRQTQMSYINAKTKKIGNFAIFVKNWHPYYKDSVKNEIYNCIRDLNLFEIETL